MPSNIRRIGVLTGGGDCPGLNAVLRAVTKSAIHSHRVEVLGIEDGFQGLVEDRVQPLTSIDVSGILTRGGTILGSNNRCNPSRLYDGQEADGQPKFRDAVPECLAMIERHRLDALIVIGGDGTMACTSRFVEAGINCIGVPKTIDNDIVGTDITFGFTTAMTTATMALDRLHSTAASHHRVMVCELMGRNAGWLALHAGVASGSDVILLPEIPFELDVICDFAQSRNIDRRGFSIIACAEGARPKGGEQFVRRVDLTSPEQKRLGGIGEWVAQQIEDRTGIETRTAVLGHVQRGGPPVPTDRVLATHFGYHAVQLLMSGARNRMVVMRQGELSDIDLTVAADGQRLVPLDDPLITAAKSMRTTFGVDIRDSGHRRLDAEDRRRTPSHAGSGAIED